MRALARWLGLACATTLACHGGAVELKVSPAGRHLLLNEKPFFWLGDTVWLLAQMPSREDLELYLSARKAQGFTVIQLTAVMGEERVWGTTRANCFGDKPFLDDNPAKPAVTPGNNFNDGAEYDYWDHVDYVLDRIHAHGFRAALVTHFVGYQGDGYKYLKPANAHAYGRFMGERYRSKPELIWVLGGDNTPNTDDKKTVWNLVAKGITEGVCGTEDYSRTLMTYHSNGGTSSSEFWHQAAWLDFNMTQTWSSYPEIYERVRKDYLLSPAKPCGLGEGAYEDGPQYPTKPINDLVIRKQAYWSYFAGGYHTYGNGNVWHFDSLKTESTQPWKEALHSPGARNLLVLRKFLDSVGWSAFVPDPALLPAPHGTGANLDCGMRTPDRSAFAFYLSSTNQLEVALGRPVNGEKITAAFVNPATGERTEKELATKDLKLALPDGWKDALVHIKLR